MPLCENFVEAMKSINKTMKEDNKAGHQWRYTNVKKRNKTFAAARKKKNFVTNCATGVDWALTIAGVPSSAQAWYGAPGKIVMVGPNAKAEMKKYFDIIKINGKKTVSQLYHAHELCEGDILTYKNLSHTNAYIGGKKSFDSGHAYCSGSGEMAPFKKWIGSLAHYNAKVAYILRLKDRIHYKVQSGAFSTKTELDKHIKDLKSKKIGYATFEEDGYTKVQLGRFDSKENAEWFANDIYEKHGIGPIVKEDLNDQV